MSNSNSVSEKEIQKILFNSYASSNTDEAKRFLYSFKILNLFWFTGDLPDDVTKPIDYSINPNWLEELIRISANGINSLSDSELAYICKRIKKARWVTRTQLKGKVAFAYMRRTSRSTFCGGSNVRPSRDLAGWLPDTRLRPRRPASGSRDWLGKSLWRSSTLGPTKDFGLVFEESSRMVSTRWIAPARRR